MHDDAGREYSAVGRGSDNVGSDRHDGGREYADDGRRRSRGVGSGSGIGGGSDRRSRRSRKIQGLKGWLDNVFSVLAGCFSKR